MFWSALLLINRKKGEVVANGRLGPQASMEHDFGPWLWDRWNEAWFRTCRRPGCFEQERAEAEYSAAVDLGHAGPPDEARAAVPSSHRHDWGPWFQDTWTGSGNCGTFRRTCRRPGCLAHEISSDYPGILYDRAVEWINPDGNVVFANELIES